MSESTEENAVVYVIAGAAVIDMEVVRLDGSFRPIDVSLAVGGHVVAEEAYGFHRRTDVGEKAVAPGSFFRFV